MFNCIDHVFGIIIIMLSQFNKFSLVDIFWRLCRTYSYLWIIIFGPPRALLATFHVEALVGRHIILTLFRRLCVELLFELAILVSESTWTLKTSRLNMALLVRVNSWWYTVGRHNCLFQLSRLVWAPSQVCGCFAHLFGANWWSDWSLIVIGSTRFNLVTIIIIYWFICFSGLISSQNWIVSKLAKWSHVGDFLRTTNVIRLHIRRIEHISLTACLVASSEALCTRFSALFYTLRNILVPLQCVISFVIRSIRHVFTILITEGIGNAVLGFHVLGSYWVKASHSNSALRPTYLLFAHQRFPIRRLSCSAAWDGSVSVTADVEVVRGLCVLRAWNTLVEEGAILALSAATVLSVGV